MRAVLAVVAGLLPAVCTAADASRCRLSKNLYEDRLALEKRGPGDSVTAGGASRLAAGAGSTSVEPGRTQAIDEEYRRFLGELAEASGSKDMSAVQACCEQAANDRAGALLCQLATYLTGGRTESKPFLDTFPSSRKDTAMLWDLDAIGGAAGRGLFPPKGPSYKLVDELFLLVLDERDQAIGKYFNLSSHATGETAKYMDDQIKIFLRESPAVVVSQWMELRRYRPKLKSLVQAMQKGASAAEWQKTTRAVRSFCLQDNPDCSDILKLYAGK